MGQKTLRIYTPLDLPHI
ncbi:unnamed protein product [Amaranthus hypochondriacus]